MRRYVPLLLAAASLPSASLALKPGGGRCHHRQSTSTRRETLQKSFGVLCSLSVLVGSNPTANAFSNKISTQYDDRPRQRGSKPKGLGVGRRTDMAGEEYVGLKPCGAAPNCFCSTDTADDSPDTSIPPFVFPAKLSREEAFQQLSDVVKAYEPGQNGIDGWRKQPEAGHRIGSAATRGGEQARPVADGPPTLNHAAQGILPGK